MPRTPLQILQIGRGDWIRTSDLLNPIQVRYQTALRPGGADLGDIVACDCAPVN